MTDALNDLIHDYVNAPDELAPSLLIEGVGLPTSPHTHPEDWNAIQNHTDALDTDTEAVYYIPRRWSVSSKTKELSLMYAEESVVGTDTTRFFTLKIPLEDIDTIVLFGTDPSDIRVSDPTFAQKIAFASTIDPSAETVTGTQTAD